MFYLLQFLKSDIKKPNIRHPAKPEQNNNGGGGVLVTCEMGQGGGEDILRVLLPHLHLQVGHGR